MGALGEVEDDDDQADQANHQEAQDNTACLKNKKLISTGQLVPCPLLQLQKYIGYWWISPHLRHQAFPSSNHAISKVAGNS